MVAGLPVFLRLLSPEGPASCEAEWPGNTVDPQGSRFPAGTESLHKLKP